MDNAFPMQIVQGKSYFCDVEDCFMSFENLFDAEKGHQITSDHVFHDQVDLVFALEGIKETDHELAMHRCQSIAFVEN